MDLKDLSIGVLSIMSLLSLTLNDQNKKSLWGRSYGVLVLVIAAVGATYLLAKFVHVI